MTNLIAVYLLVGALFAAKYLRDELPKLKPPPTHAELADELAAFNADVAWMKENLFSSDTGTVRAAIAIMETTPKRMKELEKMIARMKAPAWIEPFTTWCTAIVIVFIWLAPLAYGLGYFVLHPIIDPDWKKHEGRKRAKR